MEAPAKPKHAYNGKHCACGCGNRVQARATYSSGHRPASAPVVPSNTAGLTVKFSPELAAQITALAHDSVTARDLVSVLLVEAIAARNAENAATVAV